MGSAVAVPRAQAQAAVVADGLGGSGPCGLFPDQGTNPHLLTGRQIPHHWATREALHSLFTLLHGPP